MSAPDYTFYSQDWGGKLSEDVFNAGVSRAISFVDYVIGYKYVAEWQKKAYNKAVCAALEAFETYGYEDSGSFRIGDFSAPGGMRSGKQIAHDDICMYLGPTGLLWSGL